MNDKQKKTKTIKGWILIWDDASYQFNTNRMTKSYLKGCGTAKQYRACITYEI